MTDDRRKDEERRKKREEEQRKAKERSRQQQELLSRNRMRNLHDRHRRRRKKDCSLGMPFITAYMGDPAMPFYCNDIRDLGGNTTYELIKVEGPFVRLKRYMKHHIVNISKKVLVYKAAGPIRNKSMLDYKPDLVVVFHNHIEESKGTANMIGQAKNAGVEFKVIKETDVAK